MQPSRHSVYVMNFELSIRGEAKYPDTTLQESYRASQATEVMKRIAVIEWEPCEVKGGGAVVSWLKQHDVTLPR